ncbi:hypothetical protein ACWEPN_24585 [Nonomuraea wenchangensis]
MTILKNIGRGFASLMNVPDHIARGVGDAIGKVGDNLVASQQTKHETLRQRERHSFELLFAEAELEHDLRRGRQSHEHALAQEAHRAMCEILVRTALLRAEADQAQSPFAYSEDKIRDLVSAVTDGGERPALLFAPFYRDDATNADNDGKPSSYLMSMHHTWGRQPWQEDLGRISGVFRRPLRSLDVDSLVVRQTLADFPVVLVHGEVQEGERLWVTIEAWNPAGPGDGASNGILRVVLPFSYEALTGGRRELLRFQDEVAEQSLLVAAMLGEWFHVAAHGREPRLHRMLPSFAEPVAPLVAAASAGMLAAAQASGSVDHVVGSLLQARHYNEAGLPDHAARALREAQEALRTAPRAEAAQDARLYLTRARLLVQVLDELGDAEAARAVREEAAPVARRELMKRTRLGD